MLYDENYKCRDEASEAFTGMELEHYKKLDLGEQFANHVNGTSRINQKENIALEMITYVKKTRLKNKIPLSSIIAKAEHEDQIADELEKIGERPIPKPSEEPAKKDKGLIDSENEDEEDDDEDGSDGDTKKGLPGKGKGAKKRKGDETESDETDSDESDSKGGQTGPKMATDDYDTVTKKIYGYLKLLGPKQDHKYIMLEEIETILFGRKKSGVFNKEVPYMYMSDDQIEFLLLGSEAPSFDDF